MYLTLRKVNLVTQFHVNTTETSSAAGLPLPPPQPTPNLSNPVYLIYKCKVFMQQTIKVPFDHSLEPAETVMTRF